MGGVGWGVEMLSYGNAEGLARRSRRKLGQRNLPLVEGKEHNQTGSREKVIVTPTEGKQIEIQEEEESVQQRAAGRRRRATVQVENTAEEEEEEEGWEEQVGWKRESREG